MKNRVKVRGNVDDENFCVNLAMIETRFGRKLAFVDGQIIEVHQCGHRVVLESDERCKCSMAFNCYLDACNKSWRLVGVYNLDGTPQNVAMLDAAGGGR